MAVDSAEVIAHTGVIARRLQRDQRIDDADIAVLWLFHNPQRGAADQLTIAARQRQRDTINSASFKGMERPAVVLGLDIDATKTDRTDQVRRATYTAATRAGSMLTVVGARDAAAAIGLPDLASKLRQTSSDPPETQVSPLRAERPR